MDQEKIGQFIKKIREENNLTQKELADRLGVTFQAVSKWENGKNAPDLGILKQISDEFNVNIDEILSGKRSSKKERIPILAIIITIVSIMLLVVFCVLKINQSDYEFKTISSKCKDFKITGSAAYNKDKATIYISNVEFCGKEDIVVYRKISCNLYETYNDSKRKISSCTEEKNMNLEEFLKKVNIKVDHFSSSCKDLTANSLSLEIVASSTDNKQVTYTIPIKLNDTCQ